MLNPDTSWFEMYIDPDQPASTDFFEVNFFKKVLLGILSECQAVFMTHSVGPNCLQRLSANDKSPLARKELTGYSHVCYLTYSVARFHLFIKGVYLESAAQKLIVV